MTLEISDEQQAIIDSKEDTIVISNPGAGKTTTLSLKVIDLLKNDVSPEKILCITSVSYTHLTLPTIYSV